MLALGAGVTTLADVGTVAGIVWDATFALIAIVMVSAILDGAGFFRWAALHMARRAGGDGRAIFTAVILLGAGIPSCFVWAQASWLSWWRPFSPTAWSAGLLGRLAEASGGAAVLGTGVLVALLSSVTNNLPGVMLGCLAVAGAGATGALKEAMVLANVVGSDIGPKLTPIGSLATLIWLHGLQAKGLNVTWQSYMKVGLVITPPVLLATLAALWASMELLG